MIDLFMCSSGAQEIFETRPPLQNWRNKNNFICEPEVVEEIVGIKSLGPDYKSSLFRRPLVVCYGHIAQRRVCRLYILFQICEGKG